MPYPHTISSLPWHTLTDDITRTSEGHCQYTVFSASNYPDGAGNRYMGGGMGGIWAYYPDGAGNRTGTVLGWTILTGQGIVMRIGFHCIGKTSFRVRVRVDVRVRGLTSYSQLGKARLQIGCRNYIWNRKCYSADRVVVAIAIHSNPTLDPTRTLPTPSDWTHSCSEILIVSLFLMEQVAIWPQFCSLMETPPGPRP